MAVEKIVTFFNQEFPHVGLTPDMVKNPKPEIVFETYRCLIGQIFGFPDNVFAPDENDPQLPLQIVLHLMQSIVNDITTDSSFVMTDLIMPKPHRYRLFLGALIDFFKFIRQHVNEIDKLFEEMNQIRVKLEDDRTAIAKLGDEIEKQKQKNEILKKKTQDMTVKVTQLSTDLQNYTHQKDVIKEKVANIECEIKKKEEKIVALDASIEEAQEEGKQLARDIVSSPDKLFAEIDRTEKALIKQEEDINAYKKEARDSTRVKSEAEALLTCVNEFNVSMKAQLGAKISLVDEERKKEKESDAFLQARKEDVLKAQRRNDNLKAEAEAQLRKLTADTQFTQQNIEFAKRKLDDLEEEMKKCNECSEVKDKKEKREMAMKIKQLRHHITEMDAKYQKKENSIQNLMLKISNFIEREEVKQKESTKVFEEAIAAKENNETLNLIKKLLIENADLRNKKTELENNRNHKL